MTAREAIRAALTRETDNLARAVLVYQSGTLYISDEIKEDAKNEFLEWATHKETAREVKIASALAWANQQLSDMFGSHAAKFAPIIDLLFDVVLEQYGADAQPLAPEANMTAQQLAEFDAWIQPRHAELDRLREIDPAAAYKQALKLMDEVAEKLNVHIPAVPQPNKAAKPSNPYEALPKHLHVLFTPDHIFWVLQQFSTSVMYKLLESPKLTPLLAHRIGRSIIDHSFDRVNHACNRTRIAYSDNDEWLRWNEFIEFIERFEPHPVQMLYKQPSELSYKTHRELSNRQYHALKAVVDCDIFWLLPTNLFSFFYGLPDDRESLHQLATKQNL